MKQVFAMVFVVLLLTAGCSAAGGSGGSAPTGPGGAGYAAQLRAQALGESTPTPIPAPTPTPPARLANQAAGSVADAVPALDGQDDGLIAFVLFALSPIAMLVFAHIVATTAQNWKGGRL